MDAYDKNYYKKGLVVIALCAVIAVSLYGVGCFFLSQAHDVLGKYGVGIKEIYGENVSGLEGTWFRGYEAVEQAYLFPGLVWGFAIGHLLVVAFVVIDRLLDYREEVRMHRES